MKLADLDAVPDHLELCYTRNMGPDRHIWHSWARKLHSWGVGDWVASLLEIAGPLTVLGAQIIYLGQPYLNRHGSRSHLDALVKMLEEPETARSFAKYLREVNSQ